MMPLFWVQNLEDSLYLVGSFVQCTQIINGSVDVDSEDRQKRNLTQMYVESIFSPLLLQCRVLFNYKEIIYISSLQLALKQHRFELCRSTYMWTAFSHTVLLQSVLGLNPKTRGPTLGLEQQPSILVSRTDSGTSCTRISRGRLNARIWSWGGKNRWCFLNICVNPDPYGKECWLGERIIFPRLWSSSS